MDPKPVEVKPDLTAIFGAMAQAASEASRRTLVASFADRNPMLGKMVTCPYCRRRERQNVHACNAKINFPTTDSKSLAKGRKNPRLTRNFPPLFLIRQILLDWESEPHLSKARAAQAMLEGEPRHAVRYPVGMAHLGPLAERFILFIRETKAKAIRRRQKISRRINRGLVQGRAR
jgi:hypothetical protein